MTKSSLYRAATFCALAACLSLVCAYQTQAQTTVPDFNLFVCQSCTTPPSPAPNEGTLITNPGDFNVGDGGSHATDSPLLLIVGVPNGGAAPTLSDTGNATIHPGGTAIYGWNGSSTAVLFNASSTGDAYTAVGITPEGGGSSELFTNWQTAQTDYGLTASSSFNLYVYELSDTLPAGGATSGFDESGAPIGTIIIGYACETGDATGTPATCPDGKEGATPNTTLGIIDSVTPEPSSMLLFGTGLLLIGGILRRRLLA